MENLFAVLDRLEEADFKRFKSYVYETSLMGMKPLPRGQLEHCDATALAGKMKDAYGKVGCSIMVMHILHRMNKACLLED